MSIAVSSVPTSGGNYFYSDYCSGKIWGMQPGNSDTWNTAELMSGVGSI
jgi:hypothetical protein